MVTAPVHKAILCTDALPFKGHTEYLAQRCQKKHVSMLFAANAQLVGLVTVHQSLASVPQSITAQRIEQTLTHVHDALHTLWPHTSHHIGVLGLNPHAGEQGVLGTEECTVIEPTIMRARQTFAPTTLEGPLSPDAAFIPTMLAHFSGLVGMYHDQVLTPLKALYPRQLVNVTWGLDFLRTSVDHGTALTLAGTGQADASSLFCAIDFALEHAYDA